MMTAQLKSDSQGQTLILTLSNPELRNALSPEIYAAGVEALNAADNNPDVHSVILTGEGQMFCAGGNLQRIQSNRHQPAEVIAQGIDGLHNWIDSIVTFRKPVIAAVEGAAAGAGFSLCLACDFVVAAHDARFIMAYSNIALSPDGGGSWQLGRQLPRALASELLMLGGTISAQRLHDYGLINQVTEPGQALINALHLAQRLNARAPNALASIKELLNDAVNTPLQPHLIKERQHFIANLKNTNADIGITSFLNKTSPVYESGKK